MYSPGPPWVAVLCACLATPRLCLLFLTCAVASLCPGCLCVQFSYSLPASGPSALLPEPPSPAAACAAPLFHPLAVCQPARDSTRFSVASAAVKHAQWALLHTDSCVEASLCCLTLLPAAFFFTIVVAAAPPAARACLLVGLGTEDCPGGCSSQHIQLLLPTAASQIGVTSDRISRQCHRLIRNRDKRWLL